MHHVAPKMEPTPPTLVQFLKSVPERLSGIKNTKAEMPILAITEGQESFLQDSIAQANAFFTRSWPADKELDEQPLVDAFIAAVTAAHKLDSRLQKTFDKLVPKKVTEQQFWRRYFAHAHALLYRLSPTPEEMTYELVTKLPPARPAAQRRYAAKDSLKSSGEITRDEVLTTVTALAEEMHSNELVAALGAESAAAVEAGTYPNFDTALNKLTMHYQLEYMEQQGWDRLFGSLALQPHALMQRYPDMQGKDAPIFSALQAFISACNQAPQMAKQRHNEKPSDDPSARRFKPAATVEAAPTLDEDQLLKLVSGLKIEVAEAGETQSGLAHLMTSAVQDVEKEVADGREIKDVASSAMQRAQPKMLSQMARWQREYLESQGVGHDAGMRAVWSVGETVKPGSSSTANELLQAFGSLRMAVQGAFNNAVIDATKPVAKPAAERRFAPRDGPLQKSGPLDRALVLAFTRKCAEVLTSDESVTLLSKCCPDMQALSNLSVTWQRELLEHVGVDMDHGCRALGEVPMRFQQDNEVIKAFQAFQQACGTSAQKAVGKYEAQQVTKSDEPPVAVQ